MGQASQRRAADSAEQSIRRALEGLCQVRVCDEGGALSVLLVSAEMLGEARALVGGLPETLERRVARHLWDMKNEEQAVVGPASCYIWMRTPDGFEDVLRVAKGSPNASPKEVAQTICEAAMSRGYGLHVTTVCSGELLAVEAMVASRETSLREAAEAILDGPPVSVDDDGKKIKIHVPCVRAASGWGRLAALALREFDKACAGKRNLDKNYNRVVVSFEQLQPDERVFFESGSQAAYTIRAVAAACQPWRWVMEQRQYIIWYGAMFAKSPITVSVEGAVQFDVDYDKAGASLVDDTYRMLELYELHGGELSLDGKLTPRASDIMHLHRYLMESMPKLSAALRSGEMKRRIVERSSKGLEEGADRAYEAMRMRPSTLILDKSQFGVDTLRMLLHTTNEFPSRAVRDQLLDWYESRSPVVVIKMDPEGSGWIAESVDNEGEALKLAVERMAVESIRRLETPSWQVCAGKAANSCINAMQQGLMETILKAPGVDLRNVRMSEDVLAMLREGGARTTA